MSCEDPEIWDFANDVSLSHGKDYNFIGAISGWRLPEGKNPLFSLRGVPPGYKERYADVIENCKLAGYNSDHLGIRENLILDEDVVSYLYRNELIAAVEHVGMTRSDFYPQTLFFLKVFDCVVDEYGEESARFVFRVS